MIAYLEGELVERGSAAVVDVGGVGLAVQLSTRAVDRLPLVGQRVKLWTHLVTREDAWVLYGFTTDDERAMFRLLISVTGIGPKLAMTVLSSVSPADLAYYLSSGDEKSLVQLPGIGRKSAARLIVELGQRLPAELLGTASMTTLQEGDERGELHLASAVEVLTTMGLPAARAEQALAAARAQDPTLPAELERWVRAALHNL